jgi:hypothetical protein
MFSGHTLMYLVFALAWQKYFFVIERIIVWLLTVFCASCCVCARVRAC